MFFFICIQLLNIFLRYFLWLKFSNEILIFYRVVVVDDIDYKYFCLEFSFQCLYWYIVQFILGKVVISCYLFNVDSFFKVLFLCI